MSIRRWATKQWRRHTGVLAAAFALLAAAFGLTSAIQRIQLHDRHLFVNWGTVPDWIAGLGAFAAFGVLYLALHEWRAAQRERRDREADQARLVIAEPLPPNELPEGVGAGAFVLRNHSLAPVFNITCISLVDTIAVRSAKPRHEHFDFPLSTAVLQPGQATEPFIVETGKARKGDKSEGKPQDGAKGDDLTGWVIIPTVELATFRFTDAHGRSWQRLGSGQPVRRLAELPVSTSLEDFVKTIRMSGHFAPPADRTPT